MDKKIQYTGRTFDLETYKRNVRKKWENGTPISRKEDTLTPLLTRLAEKALRRNRESLDERSSSHLKQPEVKSIRATVVSNNSRGVNMEDLILSLHSRGYNTEAIIKYFRDATGLEVLPSIIKSVLHDIPEEEIDNWLHRPLKDFYVVVWIFTSRISGLNSSKWVDIAIGLDFEGYKEILGIYPHDNNEAAKNLYHRGVKNTVVFCLDSMFFDTALVKSYYPHSKIQHCIIHEYMDHLHKIASSDRRNYSIDFKKIFKASDRNLAKKVLEDISLKWGHKYKQVLSSLNSHWESLSEIYRYPHHLRKAMCAPGKIEVIHRALRKKFSDEVLFVTSESLVRHAYSALQYQIHKSKKNTLHQWGAILSEVESLEEQNQLN